jgi:steroid 5-alpha reductase family enzyme
MAIGWFGKSDDTPARPPDVQIQVADREPKNIYLHKPDMGPPRGLPANSTHAPKIDTHHSLTHVQSASLFDVGIFKDTLVPSLGLHSGLAVIAWGAARYTGRVEAKDWLWPSGQVINAWWSAVGRRMYEGYTLSQALSRLSWHERLILSGVTLWGGRLFYRIARRSIQRGKDDPRYDEAKKEEDFWVKSLFTVFAPEAFFQMIISLPFTAPFRHEGAVLTGYHPYVQMAAVGLFSAGLALESLADYQLDKFKAEGRRSQMLKEGVWSIVRHPNYLGDAFVHLSFIVLLYGSDMLAPVELLGPVANYVFLRYFGGDKENEEHQTRRYSISNPEKFADLEKFRNDKNSFWPSTQELGNKWLWIVLGCGGLGVAIEEGLRAFH